MVVVCLAEGQPGLVAVREQQVDGIHSQWPHKCNTEGATPVLLLFHTTTTDAYREKRLRHHSMLQRREDQPSEVSAGRGQTKRGSGFHGMGEKPGTLARLTNTRDDLVEWPHACTRRRREGTHGTYCSGWRKAHHAAAVQERCHYCLRRKTDHCTEDLATNV